MDEVKYKNYVLEQEDNKKHIIAIDNKEFEVTGKQLKELRAKFNEIIPSKK